ncbi:MAG: hypothetical protein K2K21_11880 [Lachnospiraceae bacterium]|nr:hypothetical protein [Lachnospiraceae bacterium]
MGKCLTNDEISLTSFELKKVSQASCNVLLLVILCTIEWKVSRHKNILYQVDTGRQIPYNTF